MEWYKNTVSCLLSNNFPVSQDAFWFLIAAALKIKQI